MILVAGATGMLGGEICRRLVDRGFPLRALVRPDSPRRAVLTALPVEICHGDVKQPGTLAVACRGVDTVVTTVNAVAFRRTGDTLQTVDHDGQLALVEAAGRAGVSRFVYVSVTPSLRKGPQLVNCKRTVEQAVRSSGMSWTILQPSAFMEVHLSPIVGWDPKKGRVVVFGSGRAPTSYVSVGDVAAIALLAVQRLELENRDLPIGGPEALGALDALRHFEVAMGRRLRTRRIPVPVLRFMAGLLGPLDPIRASLVGMAAQVAERGDKIDMTSIVSTYGMHLTSVEEYARRVAASLVSSTSGKIE